MKSEGDPKLFFRDLAQDFAHALYPEIVPIWTNDGPHFVVSESSSDYSLHEPPVATQKAKTTPTKARPKEAPASDLIKRYLRFQPHERSNMSVVLFNCDSARLPQAVVDKIGGMQEDEEEFDARFCCATLIAKSFAKSIARS